jgi:transposase
MKQTDQRVKPTRVLGLDVAKATVAVFDTETGDHLTLTNDIKSLTAGLRRFKAHDLAVCETTGGHERTVLAACAKLGLCAHRADAGRLKAFIRSHGAKAKTDRLDARWLAQYGLERGDQLAAYSPPSAQEEAYCGLMRRRQDLLQNRTRVKNKRSAPAVCAVVRRSLDREIMFLDKEIAAIEAELDGFAEALQGRRTEEQALTAIPGIGKIVARGLLAFLPELGSTSHKVIASIAGLAPHAHDSGQLKGYRRMRPGRKGVRPLLFMAALTASRSHPRLKDFNQRLLAAGKSKRSALAAVARKLLTYANATLKEHRQALT